MQKENKFLLKTQWMSTPSGTPGGTLNNHPKEIKVMLCKIIYLCDEVLFLVVIKVWTVEGYGEPVSYAKQQSEVISRYLLEFQLSTMSFKQKCSLGVFRKLLLLI